MRSKFTRKYTFVDLVDNINTDVKSEVADFDFQVSSKDQVVSYFENKMAQILQERQTQVKELKEENQRTIKEMQNQIMEKNLELKTMEVERLRMPPINLI